jgi:hypothetical protein
MRLPVGADNAGGFQAEEHMKELSEKEKAALEKKLNALSGVAEALEYDFPVDVTDCMEALASKNLVKDLKACLKRGGIDGTIFLGALSGVLTEWKVLSKMMGKAIDAARKEEGKINKQLGR